MNTEINNNDEDIFDIAIAMQYFKNSISSADNIHSYANHFLYRAVYKKLLSFSKEELETVFWNPENKEFHSNPKSKNNGIRFAKNIFEATTELRNPLFFSAFIEKGVFKEYYHPVIKNLLENKKTPHSLDFFEMLYHIQTSKRLNEKEEEGKEIKDIQDIVYGFTKELNTEEKIEVHMNFINLLIESGHKNFVQFVLSNIARFSDEHILIIKGKIKEHSIDINGYKVFEKYFPKTNDSSFFITSTLHEFMDKAYDFGFRVKDYQFKKLNLPCAMYSYGLNGNNIGDTWQIKFLKKILNESSFEEIDKFIINMGEDSIKLKKYGFHFENIAKEALNKKLKENLPELIKVKRNKI